MAGALLCALLLLPLLGMGQGRGKRWDTHTQDMDIKGPDEDRLRCRQTYLVPRHSITGLGDRHGKIHSLGDNQRSGDL